MILDKFNLEGKVAVVTGSSKGLGFGMAVSLAQAGCDIVGINHSAVQPETKEAVEACGKKYISIQADLSKLSVDGVKELAESAISAFGKVDILVNNAGIIRREDSLEFSEKDWDDVMNINLKNVFFLSQAIAKQFVEKGIRGKIINTASMLSYQGGIRVPSYTASKSALKGLTMLLCNEWAKYGICVNSIAPGYMATDNTEALRADKARNEAILDRIPAGRWGDVYDCGGACVFLASEASAYVNGFTLAVDGGWLAR